MLAVIAHPQLKLSRKNTKKKKGLAEKKKFF
jgi:hypothetical protein